jgi:superfamily II DNA or RNA helicase
MNSLIPRPHQQHALVAVDENNEGSISFSTGGGKTLVGIMDTMKEFRKEQPQTICVVASRKLLTCQLSHEYLEHIKNAQVMHVHSQVDRFVHYRTTNPEKIKEWTEIHKDKHKIIFCIYNSLRRIIESGIKVNTYVMDEAHNTVKPSIYEYVKQARESSDRCYFYTATLKHSASKSKPGMNNTEIYGDVIAHASAPELVSGGYILRPKVVLQEFDTVSDNPAERDNSNLIRAIDEYGINKILVSVKSTKSMMEMLTTTSFIEDLKNRGYSIMHITSLYGAHIDGHSVPRDKFFRKLNDWGKDDSKKFVVLNYSILGEGINVSCLDAVYFMRSMDMVNMLQTIGRTLRIHPDDALAMNSGRLDPGDTGSYLKPEGLVICPVYSKTTEKLSAQIQSIVDAVFDHGQLAIQIIK